MTSMSQDALTWFVSFLSYNPEPSVWLILGILLVICSTERVGKADYVDFILARKVSIGSNVLRKACLKFELFLLYASSRAPRLRPRRADR
jgi:hypothetical protein